MIKASDIEGLEKKLRKAKKNHDKESLLGVLQDAIKVEKILNNWFDRYIEIFDSTLNDTDVHKSNPIKRLYNHKYDLYIRVLEVATKAKYYSKEYV